MAEDTKQKMEQVTAELEEPSFDPTVMKKKASSKKKTVAFDDPSTEVAADNTSSAAPGSNPIQRTMSQRLIRDVGENEEDMFAGKKKKAKKILRNTEDGGDDASTAAAAVEAPAEEGDDLDFSNLKKKKKKRDIDTKVAALEATLKEAGVVDDKEAEAEGEDPFAKDEDQEATAEGEANEEEAWLKSDRNYTYEEVNTSFPSILANAFSSSCIVYSVFSARIIPPSDWAKKSPFLPLLSFVKGQRGQYSLISMTKLFDFTVHWITSRTISSPSSEQTAVLMAQIGLY
jgi:hypothetical protein